MADKEKFFCQQAAKKGRRRITEAYCFEECDSPQKGAKAQCPDSIPQPLEEVLEDTERMKELLEKLKELNLPEDEFAIFGGGPLGIRGLRKINDLDLVVLPGLWEELAQKYPVEETNFGGKAYRAHLTDDIEAVSKPSFGYDAKEVIENADVIGGIRFVNLKTTIEWKKKMGRKKDLEDIRLIEDYLRKPRP